jgi:MFS family permease
MKRKRLNAIDITLGVICLMYFVTYIDRVNIGTAGNAIKADLGLTNTELGIAFSAFAYPYALFQIAGGWLGDRYGPRITLLICGAIWSAATMLTGLVGGLASLFAVRLLLGIGEGAAFPTATRALSSWMPASKRGFAQGITHSFARLGNAVTPPLIAFLVIGYGWRQSFIVVGAISFIWVILWYWWFRDDPKSHSFITAEELQTLPQVRAKGHDKAAPWGSLLRRMVPVTLTDFCYGWTLWLYLNWIPSFFLNQFKLDLKSSALFASGVLLAGVVGDTAGGLWSDRILKRTGNVTKARVTVIVVGFLGSFVFMIPVLFVRDLATIAVCLSLAFFFAELIVAPIWAVPMDIAPEYSGTASGFMNFGFGMAGIISPVVFGAIIDTTGRWDLPFVGSLCLLIVGAALAFTMRPGQRFIGDMRAEERDLAPVP